MGRTTSLIAGGDFDAVGKEIEQIYATRFHHPFPYEDCYKLQKLQPRLAHDLIPDLDMYFSFVAGYSSSATRLKNRPVTELRAAIPRLQKSFFDAIPRYRKLCKHITPKDTPSLHQRLLVINDLRQALVIMMNQLV